jgi:hypothetical protein
MDPDAFADLFRSHPRQPRLICSIASGADPGGGAGDGNDNPVAPGADDLAPGRTYTSEQVTEIVQRRLSRDRRARGGGGGGGGAPAAPGAPAPSAGDGAPPAGAPSAAAAFDMTQMVSAIAGAVTQAMISAQAASQPGAAAAALAAVRPSALAPPISDKGSPVGQREFEQITNPKELTRSDIERLQAKHGLEKANEMIRDMARKYLRNMKFVP